ncbi:hypothetical protein [Mesorhizobium sp. WSM3859]|uniref:hypothetical protein n=1 Tax=Mesorhizobium sp. WSM3859 TaxID=2029402 RepID=UPI000BB09FD9|nr:hypothetical protein [Mesorhizobium sp. WSM3859]PBC11301.1 hypothetical protein CK230_04400 [Mesorhizobium sp. WSM3859]
MRASFVSLLFIAMSIGGANADATRDAYEACLDAGFQKFKDLCEPADLVARTVAFECNPQLYDLIRSMPRFETTDKVTLAQKLDKEEEIIAHVLEYRLQHPCRIN